MTDRHSRQQTYQSIDSLLPKSPSTPSTFSRRHKPALLQRTTSSGGINRGDTYSFPVRLPRNLSFEAGSRGSEQRFSGYDEADETDPRLSTKQLICLVASMLGAQLCWSVEMGQGNPFLLSLGLSKQVSSLVWLAGPVTGLVCQPIIGALSGTTLPVIHLNADFDWSKLTDSETHKYRRRKYIVISSICVGLFALGVAYCRDIASGVVSLTNGDVGDWDPARNEKLRQIAIAIAIPCFWGLDFSLNALQAASRALILDTATGSEQSTANAWQGRVTHLGNVIGYSLVSCDALMPILCTEIRDEGFIDLVHNRAIALIPGNQFAKLCVCSVICMAVCSTITCVATGEKEVETIVEEEGGLKASLGMLGNVRKTIMTLPLPVKRVCYVQFWAWLGWFPFLFFSSTFVAEQFAVAHPEYSSGDDAALRYGSLALLSYSLVAFLSGIVLPGLQELGSSDFLLSRPANKAWNGLRRLLMACTLRHIWTASHIFFALTMVATFMVHSVERATICISAVGICWAVTCWIPFAMVMEMVRAAEGSDEAEEEGLAKADAGRALSECAPLIGERKQSGGATILGIHNLAIVAPQLIVSVVSSGIFKLVDLQDPPENHRNLAKRRDVVYVFLFGAVSALVAAAFSLYVPQTGSERIYLVELREANEEYEELEEE